MSSIATEPVLKIQNQDLSQSEEKLKAFLEKVKGDTSLQGMLTAAADANAVVEIAKQVGFVISADDINKAQSEILDEGLERVAGGVDVIEGEDDSWWYTR